MSLIATTVLIVKTALELVGTFAAVSLDAVVEGADIAWDL